ncbi:MAG: substrate-binding domain-containing protein [Chthoniobacterales bacterium]
MSLKSSLVVVSLVLSILIGLFLGKSGDIKSVGKTAGRPLIGISLDTLKEARWQADAALFKQRCEELGADVLVQSANGDDTRQINDVQSLISRKINVLVIVPHDGAAMAKGVQIAHEAGIPVIAYDRLIKNCDLDVYLSFDNIKVGRLQAQWILDHLPTPGKGRIVLVNGSKTDNNAFLFHQGAMEVFQPLIDKGDVQIVWEDWTEDWKLENAKKIVNAALSKLGKDGFDAVLAAADGVAGGSIQALSEEGVAGKILVTGQDAELVACQRIIGGTQSMTIYKPLKKLASNAAEVAIKMAKGKPVIANKTVNNGQIDVPSVLGDIFAVDKTNMMETVIADGFQKKEAVYGTH